MHINEVCFVGRGIRVAALPLTIVSEPLKPERKEGRGSEYMAYEFPDEEQDEIEAARHAKRLGFVVYFASLYITENGERGRLIQYFLLQRFF
ncbi:hypothetical protein E2C01_034749 [Portunus trituberculatus]|uniref:Uncharacterized protein n=1 Tax=Portunus trituberculatus TaxID=210409 RepID=A0A5B7F7U7_PORTR|nr:hypothetical protein [Portunus trituberculatus]